ncbi:hypothetical protein ACET3Z_013125 [Daucus carota]
MSNSKILNRYDKVEHLRPQRTEWTIRVRAQAVWIGINRETQDFRGFNVIFIDDSNARIHAFQNAKICDFFKDSLKEGCIYTLSNFHVRAYTKEDRNRDVRFNKHIYFANHTKLKLLIDNVTKIAPYDFDLIKLSDVAQCVADARFLVDVVGEIENTNIECNRNKDDDKKSHIRFRITDGRTSLNVTFFNQFGEEFEKALKDNISAQVIVVIVSAKANEHEEAVVPSFTIAEIKKLGNEYKEQKQVQCIITVKKVDQKSNWCDNVCKTCGEEVNIVEGRYKCVICSRSIPFPDKRFRLATILH